MPLLSIIVPIYNVEKYLHQCVDSVLNQSFQDMEVVLVDDGSPDGCPRICDEYAQKDARVKVIHKPNGGLSDARNAGIQAAGGEYLMFLDSDDYWEGDCLANLVRELQDRHCDVLIHGCKDYSCRTHTLIVSRSDYDHARIASSSKKEVLEYLFTSGKFPGSAWITVTRRQFVLDNALFFVKGIKAEDIDWLLNVFLHANSFGSVDDSFYIYLKYRTDSITGTADSKSIGDILFTIEKWQQILQQEEYAYIRDYANSFLAYHFFTALILYNRLPSSQKAEMIVRLKRVYRTFHHLKIKKARVANVICKVLGIKLGAKALSAYHNANRV